MSFPTLFSSPFEAGPALIQETAKFGYLRYLGPSLSDPVLALQALLTSEPNSGWPERLLMNYEWICRSLAPDLFLEYHYIAGDGDHFLDKLLQKINGWSFPVTGNFLCFSLGELKMLLACIYMNWESTLAGLEIQLALFATTPSGKELLPTLPLDPLTAIEETRLFQLMGDDPFAFSYCPKRSILTSIINSDNFSLLSMYETGLGHSVVERITFLSHHAPAYFALLLPYLRQLLLEKEDKFSLSQLIQLIKAGVPLVKGVTATMLEELSPLAIKITLLETRYLISYYLGFRVDRETPPLSALLRALLALSELGPSAYAAKVIPPLQRHPHAAEVAGVCAELDLFLNKFTEYHPFDVLEFLQDERTWLFTRSSFAALLDSKTNPYNRKGLPREAIEKIDKRLALAKRLSLPEAAPLATLLTELTEIKENEEKKSEAETKSSSQAAYFPPPVFVPSFESMYPSLPSAPQETTVQLAAVELNDGIVLSRRLLERVSAATFVTQIRNRGTRSTSHAPEARTAAPQVRVMLLPARENTSPPLAGASFDAALEAFLGHPSGENSPSS